MRVTFLIGNGFDLNLGLKTKYENFLESFFFDDIAPPPPNSFKNYISNEFETWADLEYAIGQVTSKYCEADINNFIEGYKDLCLKLDEYLEIQDELICFDKKTASERMVSSLLTFPNLLSETGRVIINSIFDNDNENCVFEFICFNYTSTLKRCKMFCYASIIWRCRR